MVGSCGAFDNLPPRVLISVAVAMAVAAAPNPELFGSFLTRSATSCHPAIITNNLFVCHKNRNEVEAGELQLESGARQHFARVCIIHEIGCSCSCSCTHMWHEATPSA